MYAYWQLILHESPSSRASVRIMTPWSHSPYGASSHTIFKLELKLNSAEAIDLDEMLLPDNNRIRLGEIKRGKEREESIGEPGVVEYQSTTRQQS